VLATCSPPTWRSHRTTGSTGTRCAARCHSAGVASPRLHHDPQHGVAVPAGGDRRTCGDQPFRAGTVPATGPPHGRGLRTAIADDGRPLRHRPHAPHRLPCDRGCADRRGGPAGVRRRRVPEVPTLRGVEPRLREGSVRRLCVRAAGAVQLQGAGFLSKLRWPADGRAGRAPRGSRPTCRCASGCSLCRSSCGDSPRSARTF
jgi:hypothetical protein